jgi:hypothetical protein
VPQDALAVVRRRLHSERLASGHFAKPAQAKARIEATLFTELNASDASALQAVVERFGRFMELPATLEIAH